MFNILRGLAAAIILVSALAVAPAVAQANDVTVPSVDDLKREVVLIRATNPQTGLSYKGAGVIIGQKDDTVRIITAGHLAVDDETHKTFEAEGYNYTVQFNGGETLPMSAPKKLVADFDLATVDVSNVRGHYPAAKFAEQEIQPGERAIVIGHPGTSIQEWVVSPVDTIAQYEEDDVVRGRVFSQGSTNRGDSGGPVFNTTGELVGIYIRVGWFREKATDPKRDSCFSESRTHVLMALAHLHELGWTPPKAVAQK